MLLAALALSAAWGGAQAQGEGQDALDEVSASAAADGVPSVAAVPADARFKCIGARRVLLCSGSLHDVAGGGPRGAVALGCGVACIGRRAWARLTPSRGHAVCKLATGKMLKGKWDLSAGVDPLCAPFKADKQGEVRLRPQGRYTATSPSRACSLCGNRGRKAA